MKHLITGKQPNSRLCFVCGLKNPYGLKASFYETQENSLIAIFHAGEEHQSYPNRLHGGISAAILDETIGRSIMAGRTDEIWGVTVDLQIKYRKPVPLDHEIKVIGRITSENGRFFEGSGEIVLENGDIAVSATGRYIKMPLDRIADFDADEQEWKVINNENDPEHIHVGGIEESTPV